MFDWDYYFDWWYYGDPFDEEVEIVKETEEIL